MKALAHNSIETIPENLWRCDFAISFRPSSEFGPGCEQSATIKSAFGSTLPASPPTDVGLGRKRYVGPIAHLRGKTALVQPRTGATGEVMAQFEELHLQEARGWWQFSIVDFETLGSPVSG